jgi:flavin reductase (DIM6/NTAB) family NADH-FMN oxidoreductase RutF
MRKDFDPADRSSGDFYRLMTAVIVPRPIAWVASTSADGVDNLAPHSLFTISSTAPPIVQFTSVGTKDSLRNVLATREFTINLAPESLFEQINATGTDYPADQSEFDAVGLTREPSRRVSVPRVAESPVAIECALHHTVGFGTSTVVFGRVLHLAIAADAMADDGLPAIDRLAPLARLGRNEWGATREVRSIERTRFRDLPEG